MKQHKIDIYLTRAAMLLYRDGYQRLNTTQAVDTIDNLQRLGKNHITDKLHLTLEVMEFIHTLEKQHVFCHMDSPVPTEEKLYTLLCNIQKYLVKYDYFVLMIRLSHLPKESESEIHTYCHYYFKSWTDAFADLFAPTHGTQAKHIADNLFCMIVGAVSMNKVQPEDELFQYVTTWAMKLFHQAG